MRTETAVALSALKKNSVVLGGGSRDTPHIQRRARMNPHMLCSAVLILVTAEGLTTRDSTGSNQRKPDFFSPQRNRLPLVSNSALEEKNLCFRKDVDYHNSTWWHGTLSCRL